MYTLLIIIYVLVSLSLVGLVLIQQGKGADAGAAFGSGASGTVFGSRGSANFLTRATAALATTFFLLSLALAYVVHGRNATHSVIDDKSAAPAAAAVLTTPAPGAPVAATPSPAAVTEAPAANTAAPEKKDDAQKAAPSATPKVPN